MPSSLSKARLARRYDEAAQEYLRSLPLEHFMEATCQSTQRKITVESLDLVMARRSDVHVFSELLVQYPRPRKRKPGQVVPDNMVVLHDGAIEARINYALPLQPARPFWVLEYVSHSSRRKDYEESFDKYEQELRVPYYLIFYPDILDLTLYHLRGEKYVSVKPNKQGRYAIRELDLEVGMLDGWVRFWHEGRLLPLPVELQQEVDAANRRAEEERQRAEAERQRAEAERQRADSERQYAEAERQRAEAERQRANEEAQRAAALEQRLREAEEELARLRTRSEQGPRRGNGAKPTK